MANKKISELNINSSPSTSATLVGVDNGETVQIPIGALSSGSGSSGGGIIPVDALPTENIDTSAIYVVTQPEVVGAQIFKGETNLSEMSPETYHLEVVDTLPNDAKVCTDASASFIYGYYLTSDNSCLAYVDDELASAIGAPSGWYPFETMFTQFGYSYGGVIESADEITDTSAFYILAIKADKKNLYHYKNGAFAQIASFASTSDIVATPNPCIYKVYEIDEFHIIGVVTDENGVVTNTYIDDMEGMNVYTEVVNELPEIGEGFIKDDGTAYLYYTRIEGSICAYLTEEIASALEMPVGWLPFMSSGEFPIIESLEDVDGEYDTYGLVAKKPHLYFYDGDDWLEISTGFRIVHNPKLETITFIES